MSFVVLTQVYDEVKRLSIAGSNLAVNDFRLKKLIAPLEASAKKAPVFGKVALAIEKLISGNEKDSAQSLLDLASLVFSILYTQGQTGAEGRLLAIESIELDLPTVQVSARVLKPVIEALTSKGGGRMEIIREAFEQGAFSDLRLVNPAIAALDDSYSEIADFVAEKILPKYGKAILPGIRNQIDIRGRSGNVRRLRLMHQLSPDSARPVVLDAFENGSKEMKIAALGCLGTSPDDLRHILDQASARSKEVRRVAISRLGNYADSEAIVFLEKAMGGADLEIATRAINRNPNKAFWTRVIQMANAEFDQLAQSKDKTKTSKLLQRQYLFLSCFYTKSDKQSIEFLSKSFERREWLRKLKGTKTSGEDLFEKLCRTMYFTNNKMLLGRLVDGCDTMQGTTLVWSFAAAVSTLPAKKVFDQYSQYYMNPPRKNRRVQFGSMIVHVLTDGDLPDLDFGDIVTWRDYDSPIPTSGTLKTVKPWDPRWIDAAIQSNDIDGALRLGNPKHKGLKEFLKQKFDTLINGKSIQYDLFHVLEGMIKMKYAEATDCMIAVLRRIAKSKSHYYSHWFSDLISRLPKTSAAKVEKLIPELPDRIVDDILPHIRTLKSKSK